MVGSGGQGYLFLQRQQGASVVISKNIMTNYLVLKLVVVVIITLGYSEIHLISLNNEIGHCTVGQGAP